METTTQLLDAFLVKSFQPRSPPPIASKSAHLKNTPTLSKIHPPCIVKLSQRLPSAASLLPRLAGHSQSPPASWLPATPARRPRLVAKVMLSRDARRPTRTTPSGSARRRSCSSSRRSSLSSSSTSRL